MVMQIIRAWAARKKGLVGGGLRLVGRKTDGCVCLWVWLYMYLFLCVYLFVCRDGCLSMCIYV